MLSTDFNSVGKCSSSGLYTIHVNHDPSREISYVHTLLCLEILDTVSHHSGTACLLEVQLCGRHDLSTLVVLGEINILEALLDVEAKVSMGIAEIPPCQGEPVGRQLSVCADIDEGCRHKLQEVIADGFHAWISCPDGDETFDQRLQVFCFAAHDVSRLSNNLVNRIIGAKATINVSHVADRDWVEKGSCGRCGHGHFDDGGVTVRFLDRVIASEAASGRRMRRSRTDKPQIKSMVRHKELKGKCLTLCSLYPPCR